MQHLLNETETEASESANRKNAFTLTITENNVGVATFDLDGSPVNLLSFETMAQLNDIIGQATKKSLRGLIIASAKKENFIAGGDINEITRIQSANPIQGYLAASLGKTIFARLEEAPFATVAAINGAALGGGAELALACRYRVAASSPATKIGFPEVNLGLLPGWGGCVRLTKKLGMIQATEMITTGKNLDAAAAWKCGLVDEIVDPATLLNAAEKVVLTGRPMRSEPSLEGTLARFFTERNPAGRSVFSFLASKQIKKQSRGNYPAPMEILKVVLKSVQGPPKLSYEAESQAFARLAAGAVSRNLISIFFAQQESKKIENDGDSVVLPETVGVLGSGIMGAGIAQAAAYAGFKVLLYDISEKILDSGVKRITKLFDNLVDKRKLTGEQADEKVGKIGTTTELSELHDCDFVIEAVIEDLETKKRIVGELSESIKKDFIFATNTSSLSVKAMSQAADKPENIVGVHFFNPVHRMPLVEIIKTDRTSIKTANTAKKFAQKLGKTTVTASDSPGFIVNRILAPYLRESLVLLEQGVSANDIDDAAMKFGMPVGPIALLDDIGLDVAATVMESMTAAFGERLGPIALFELVKQQKLLGKKNKKGLYLYDANSKRRDINPAIALEVHAGSSRKTIGELQDRLILLMINEAAMCLDEGVAANPGQLDLAMIFGTGFPPFRGGPLRYADQVSTPLVLQKLELLESAHGHRYQACNLLVQLGSARQSFYGLNR